MSSTEVSASKPPLSRPIRIAVIAVIVVFHLFLIGTSRDPLRLNVGDPWSEANVLSSLPYVKHYGFLKTSFTDVLDVGPLTEESYRYTHYPPLSEIIYGAIHKFLGVDSLQTLRLFAIGFSALAMWLLFCYVRRLYDSSIALIATMLWASNLLWMMYADMIHQAPIMQASAFLALWGLIRGLDEPRRRYWVAAWAGSFACFLTSYDYFIFLPIAVLVTVYLRKGNPLRRANWKPILICASGCLAAIILKCLFVIGAVGWTEFLDDLHFQFLERSTSTFEQHTSAVIPSLTRRASMVFSPLIWVVVGISIVRLIRPSTRRRFFTDGTWLAIPALMFFVVFSQLAGSQMLTMQVALPFYSICSALLLVQLLRSAKQLARVAGVAILLFAPLWSGFWLLHQERSYLDEEGFKLVRKYLDEHDQNDFVMCNLMADGPIQAYLGRHYWPAFSSAYYAQYHGAAIDVMDRLGTDDFYVLFFKDPNTRMIDKSLWPIAMPKHQWSVTGSPLFWPKKAEKLIREYDEVILDNLKEVHAERVLSRPQMDLYRITRADVMRAAFAGVPATQFVDLGSFNAEKHELPGWGGERWDAREMLAGSPLSGHPVCPWWAKQWCRTVLTKRGLITQGHFPSPSAKLMMRASATCDAQLRIGMIRPAILSLAINGKPIDHTIVDSHTLEARVPRAQLVDGVNIVDLSYSQPLSDLEARVRRLPPWLSTIELRQSCR